MVEVEVRDDDRVQLRPGLLLAQARQDTWPAVQQDSARAFDEISRLGAAGIRPGGRAPNDRQLHAESVA
jgi:hypothetical protein